VPPFLRYAVIPVLLLLRRRVLSFDARLLKVGNVLRGMPCSTFVGESRLNSAGRASNQPGT
jgi:hypothetical protein